MDESPLARTRRIGSAACRWFVVRLGLFITAVLIAQQLPGWLKGPVWVVAFAMGVWAFVALVRESTRAVDHLLPRLAVSWQRLGVWMERRAAVWKILGLACCVVLLGITVFRAWPAWHFLATSSLREDEILNIERYTSKGIAPAVGTYNLARNHIFYNVVNALIPGSGSLSPLRGRLVSLTAVVSALLLIVAYAARRGWLLAGVACAGFVAVDLYALKVVLEGRGYGLICFFGVLACLALTEWLRTRRQFWLNTLAVACVLGTYTLPYFVVFGGSLLLVAFFHRPSRDTLLAGGLSLAGIGMLYLPILDKVLKVASGYDDEYGDTVTYNFGAMDAVFRTMQYFISYEMTLIGPLFFILTLLLALLFMMFGRFARLSDRHAAAGVALGILAMLAALLYLKAVPIRVSAFLAGPQAFLALLMAGSVLAAKSLVPVRPALILAFTALVGSVLWHAEIKEPLLPRQNWSGFAELIERAFPADTRVWVGEKYDKLLQPHFSTPRTVGGEINGPAMAGGRLLAFEPYFKIGHEKKRLRWEDLPEGVRYVTAPLLINYQRLFFVPPASRGISRVEVDGREVPSQVSGRQPRDPVTLSTSGGHGDTLYKNADATTGLEPEAIALPATVEITFAAATPPGSCNALFSQILGDKIVDAEVQDAGGNWRKVPAFVLGEMASVRLAEGAKAVRLRVSSNPAFQPSARLDGPRPAFGLLDTWTSPL